MTPAPIPAAPTPPSHPVHSSENASRGAAEARISTNERSGACRSAPEGEQGRRGATFWAQRAWVDGAFRQRVRIAADGDGRIRSLESGVEAPVDALRLDTAVPGFGNAHSHAFHRELRGRTHDHGGDFWAWRREMYRLAGALDPDEYRRVATLVYAEMVAAGYTAVGEFHYLHHQPDGTPYHPPHAMETALADAAETVGIRLVLLDTCYLRGGIGRPLNEKQRRFGDGTAGVWLDRWHRLSDALSGRRLVTVGAAVHSVRAVPPEALALIARELPDDVPLHAHVSEQPLENEQSLSEYGRTPVGVLEHAGLLSPRLAAVHATHLTDDDIRMLGAAGAGVVACPTTEADLGDGIGPMRRLADAGATIATGSDQHAVIDPLLELRGLEHGQRLATLRRGRFTPTELWAAGTVGGYRALGLDDRGLRPGADCDLVELHTETARTRGSAPDQLVMTATGADVGTVVVGGQVVAGPHRGAPDVRAPAGTTDRIRTVEHPGEASRSVEGAPELAGETTPGEEEATA